MHPTPKGWWPEREAADYSNCHAVGYDSVPYKNSYSIASIPPEPDHVPGTETRAKLVPVGKYTIAFLPNREFTNQP
jgi:hypothetical protein